MFSLNEHNSVLSFFLTLSSFINWVWQSQLDGALLRILDLATFIFSHTSKSHLSPWQLCEGGGGEKWKEKRMTQILALKSIFTSALGRIPFLEKCNILVLTTHNSLYLLNISHTSVRIQLVWLYLGKLQFSLWFQLITSIYSYILPF